MVKFKKRLKKEWKEFYSKINKSIFRLEDIFYGKEGLLIIVASIMSSIVALNLTGSYDALKLYSLIWKGIKITTILLPMVVGSIWIYFTFFDFLNFLFRLFFPKMKKKSS